MNLQTVFINCLYLLGISMIIAIVVNMWLQILNSIHDYKKRKGARAFEEALSKAFEKSFDRGNKNE